MKKRWILFLVVCSLLTTGIISIRMKSTNISDVQTEEQQKNRNQTAKEAGPQKSAIELEFKDFDRLEPEFAKGQVDNLQRLMTRYLEEYEEKVLDGTVTYHPEKTEYKDQQNILLYFTISSATGEEKLKVSYDMLQDVFSFTENKIIMEEG